MTDIAELEARISAAKRRLGDLKRAHTLWSEKAPIDRRQQEEEILISQMEQIAYSTVCYLDGLPGPYRKRMKAEMGDTWTQEELDAAKKEGEELSKKIKWV